MRLQRSSRRIKASISNVTCDSVRLCVRALPGQGQAWAGLRLLPRLPRAAQAQAAPRAGRAAHRAAGVAVAESRVAAVLVILVIKNHFAEHQEVLGGPTSLRRLRLRLE